MTKEEIQAELDSSLARIDESFSEIKDEITKPLDDVVSYVEENPLIAVGIAAMTGIALSLLLGGRSSNKGSQNSQVDRRSVEALIEAGIANKDNGMNLSEAVHSAIRDTPVNTHTYSNYSKPKSLGILSILSSKAGRALTQTLLKNGIGIVNGIVKDRIQKG